MRRVEPRLELNGRGMATDPEKIQDLQDEYGRKERANAPKPKKPFKKVIQERANQKDS